MMTIKIDPSIKDHLVLYYVEKFIDALYVVKDPSIKEKLQGDWLVTR